MDFKFFFVSFVTVIGALVLISCGTQNSIDGYYMSEHSSTSAARYIEAMPNLKQAHINRLNRLRSRAATPDVAVNEDETTTTTTPEDNNKNATPPDLIAHRRNLKIPNISARRDRTNVQPPNSGEGLPNLNDLDERTNILESYRQSEISEYQRAIEIMDEGLKAYKFVKIKVFPIEPISGREYIPYTSTCGWELKYTTLENVNGFSVTVVDWSNKKLISDLGTFKKINIEFGQPTNPVSSENKITMLNDNSEAETYILDKLSGDKSVVLKPVVEIEEIPEGVDTNEELLNSGFSNIRWGDPDKPRHIKGRCPPMFVNNRDKFPDEFRESYFYRGSFEITHALRYKSRNQSRRIWTVVNQIDIDDYVYAVASKELRQAANLGDAKKAQAIATRTFTVFQAEKARTGHRPRTWDLLPTTADQAYVGVKGEVDDFKSSVRETNNLVLTLPSRRSGQRLVVAHYFGCTDKRTVDAEDSGLPEQKARVVPSTVDCSYARNSITTKQDSLGTTRSYGHGRGMCQKCAIHLAANGWDDPGTQPSQDAAIPDNIRRPWNYDSILRYFYDNSKVSNMDTVSLVQ